MNTNLRKGIYAAMVAINAGCIALVSQNMLPGMWVSVAGIVSVVISSFMKSAFQADPPAELPESK